MPTTDLPVIGTVERRWVLAGAALVAGIVGYAYYKRRQSSAAAAATAIDPATGLPYTAESMSAGGSYSNPNPGAVGAATVTGTTQITTDAQWSQQVLQQLAGIIDTTALATALGKYLAGQPLTTDESLWIRTAWALVGHPPGNQQIILVGSGSTPGAGAQKIASRIDDPGNIDLLRVKITQTSWLGVLQAHYTNLPTDPTTLGNMAYVLAHINAQSGAWNPAGKTFALPQTLTYS